MKKGKFME